VVRGRIAVMRRADRLFQIVQLLRRRRTATTALHIAERLGVSERTVYRDIRDLVLAGTPIDGAAGVGYRIRPGYDLPPLMFDREEIQALVLGARIVRQFGDPGLARASEAILNKVAAHQNRYRTLSCMSRRVSDLVVMRPKFALLGSDDATPFQFG
jgi:predicted DNA-binding transcriptional regulator YafY